MSLNSVLTVILELYFETFDFMYIKFEMLNSKFSVDKIESVLMLVCQVGYYDKGFLCIFKTVYKNFNFCTNFILLFLGKSYGLFIFVSYLW